MRTPPRPVLAPPFPLQSARRTATSDFDGGLEAPMADFDFVEPDVRINMCFAI